MTTWLLLRGLAREQRHWGAFPELLRQRLPAGDEVIARDLPGTGTRCLERSPSQVAAMTQALREDLRANGSPGPCVAVALSLGAMVTLQWAATAPQELRGCVLINSSLAALSPFWQRLRPGAVVPLLRWLLSASPEAKERAVFDISSNRAFDPAVLAQWVAIAQSAPVSAGNAVRQLFAAARFEAPAALPVPALVLTSAGDRLVSHRCSRAMARHWQLPLQEHPHAGHDLPLDDPAWLADAIARWGSEILA
jgi:pimeloyl-ACP methyl ester carboxylesterase